MILLAAFAICCRVFGQESVQPPYYSDPASEDTSLGTTLLFHPPSISAITTDDGEVDWSPVTSFVLAIDDLFNQGPLHLSPV